MYEQQFGFSRPLFADGIPQDEAVFRTAATGQLGQDLALALTRRDSVIVISGASGTGKTTIAADALKNVGTRLAFTCISSPPLTPHELLEQLLNDFGFEPYRQSRVERLQTWRQFLSEMTATDTRVCLLVENTENLTADVLKALHTLTAADAGLCPGANVILTTTLPTERLLIAPELLAFNQRVRLRRQIEPLTPAEIDEYLEFKCRLGTAARADVFDTDVGAVLYDFSGGVVRVVDNLLETALMAAAADSENRVSAARIASVAQDQFGMTRMTANEVDVLLDEGDDTLNESIEAGDEDPPGYFEDIPTLTEYVTA